MNAELRELYQEIILDHNKNPRHHHEMIHPSRQAKGFNPLCGDKLTVYLKIQQDKIVEASFLGCGCAISQASASMMTEAILGLSLSGAALLFKQMHELLTLDAPSSGLLSEKLKVLEGVKAFPARVKCASLAWHTLDAALKQGPHEVSTEGAAPLC